jgi:hypothetical protein
MNKIPDPHETGDTTLGQGSARLSPAPGIRRINVNNRDEVYDLAVVMQNASVRRLMQVIHAESRAVAKLAAEAAPVASQAEEYLRLLAAKAPADEIRARLEALADTAGIKL